MALTDVGDETARLAGWSTRAASGGTKMAANEAGLGCLVVDVVPEVRADPGQCKGKRGTEPSHCDTSSMIVAIVRPGTGASWITQSRLEASPSRGRPFGKSGCDGEEANGGTAPGG